MVLSKKTMMMGGISLAAVAALVVLAGVGMNNKSATVEAEGTSYILTLDNTNGLTDSINQKNAGSYTWNTATSTNYHTTWTGSGINYSFGCFLHIAQNLGEFYNTVTLHQITSITATGTEGTGTTAGELVIYTSTDGSTWTKRANNITSDNPYTISEKGIGYVKFQYNRDSGATENYVKKIVISYDCLA